MEQLLENKRDQGVAVRRNIQILLKDKKFVRYDEGAEVYSMHQKTFEKIAKEANARYKVGKMVLVNTQIVDRYLETFRLIES